MPSHNAPGVYVEEISTLPPSVTEVATAVPAFVGYTNDVKGGGLRVAQVQTLREYEAEFGKAAPTPFTVTVKNTETDPNQPPVYTITQIDAPDAVSGVPAQMMWYAIDLYFRNGGGRCYVVSIGKLNTPKPDDFKNGLEELKKYEEPTLIVIPEILQLDKDNKGTVLQATLAHCHTMGNRFAIVDAYEDEKDNEKYGQFKYDVSGSYLDHAAAYYPSLDTALACIYEDQSVKVQGFAVDAQAKPNQDAIDSAAKALAQRIKEWLQQQYSSKADASSTAIYKNVIGDEKKVNDDVTLYNAIKLALQRQTTPISSSTIVTPLTEDNGGLKNLIDSLENCKARNKLKLIGSGQEPVGVLAGSNQEFQDEATAPIAITAADVLQAKGVKDQNIEFPSTLDQVGKSNTALYNLIKQALDSQRVRLPPSPAMAGVYARVDRERGVWKAPANVGLMSVIGPAVQITSDEQDTLNVDLKTGKSINAIRSFPGKGVLVWGARTLDGEGNEWRYVPVRRLFLTIEESVKRASAFAVFEPNDATTWLKVRGMIESYLYGLWQQGALQGADPKAAYYVNVGLGRTMTPQDVLDGVMIVEVGIAAVRPAEFIVLRFSHKLATA